MVNAVVPHAELEVVALDWARRINGKSPTAQRMLKYAFNLIDDGLVGQQLFAGEATRLAYGTDEAAEGRDAFLEKRAARLVAVPLLLLIERVRAAAHNVRGGGRGGTRCHGRRPASGGGLPGAVPRRPDGRAGALDPVGATRSSAVTHRQCT